jgi:hypothetical protein
MENRGKLLLLFSDSFYEKFLQVVGRNASVGSRLCPRNESKPDSFQ